MGGIQRWFPVRTGFALYRCDGPVAGQAQGSHADFAQAWPRCGRSNRRAEWAEFKGGSLFELGSHFIDATVRLLGKPKAVTPILRKHGRGADDLIAALNGRNSKVVPCSNWVRTLSMRRSGCWASPRQSRRFCASMAAVRTI